MSIKRDEFGRSKWRRKQDRRAFRHALCKLRLQSLDAIQESREMAPVWSVEHMVDTSELIAKANIAHPDYRNPLWAEIDAMFAEIEKEFDKLDTEERWR